MDISYFNPISPDKADLVLKDKLQNQIIITEIKIGVFDINAVYQLKKLVDFNKLKYVNVSGLAIADSFTKDSVKLLNKYGFDAFINQKTENGIEFKHDTEGTLLFNIKDSLKH